MNALIMSLCYFLPSFLPSFSNNPLNSPPRSPPLIKQKKKNPKREEKKCWLPFYLWESSCAPSFSKSVHYGWAGVGGRPENTKEKKGSVLYEGIIPYNMLFFSRGT
jgi:hypothetical protein